MSKVMYDDVTVSLLPSGAYAYVGYVDGIYRNLPAVRQKYPKAHVLSIAVFAQDDADALDMEPGDATIAQAYDWFNRQVKRGVQRPVLYIAASAMASLEKTMYANKIPREKFRLWSAHYTYSPHFCGPHTCGYGLTQADATQFTDKAKGLSLDESVITDTFFGAVPAPSPPPAPKPPAPKPEWIWSVDTPRSLVEISGLTSTPVSTILAQTYVKFGPFSSELSGYLQAGDLTAKLPHLAPELVKLVIRPAAK